MNPRSSNRWREEQRGRGAGRGAAEKMMPLERRAGKSTNEKAQKGRKDCKNKENETENKKASKGTTNRPRNNDGYTNNTPKP